MMARSFHKRHLLAPSLSGQNVIISMHGGKIRAKAELLKAPTREITAPKLGMAIANMKVMKTNRVLVPYSAKSLKESEWKLFLVMGQTMLKET